MGCFVELRWLPAPSRTDTVADEEKEHAAAEKSISL